MATVIRQGCRSVKQLQHNPCLPHSRTEQNPWPEFPKVFTTDYGQEEAIAKFKEDAREFCVMTQEFLGGDGHVTGLRISQNTMQMINGKRTEVPIPGTERIIPAQVVLLAMGFAGSEQRLVDEFHVEKNARGSIAASDKDYKTSPVFSPPAMPAEGRASWCGLLRRDAAQRRLWTSICVKLNNGPYQSEQRRFSARLLVEQA